MSTLVLLISLYCFGCSILISFYLSRLSAQIYLFYLIFSSRLEAHEHRKTQP